MPISLRALEAADVDKILKWNEGTDARFLMQWAGNSFEYPLTRAQVAARISGEGRPYAVVLGGEMIGTVELCRIGREEGVAWVARFLMEEASRGRGYGEAALRALSRVAFEDMGLRRLRLTVFEFNKGAVRCYEKVGFAVYERVVYDNGWAALRMELGNR